MNITQHTIDYFGRDGFYIRRTTKTDCPDCVAGPTGQSISACETCNSQGYIYNYYFVPMRAIISWRKLESRSVMIAAITVDGDCAIGISYDDYSSIDLDNDEFVVDGRLMKLATVIPSDQNSIFMLGLTYSDT